MYDSSMDRVALSEKLTFYMTTLRAANKSIKHRNDNVYRLQIKIENKFIVIVIHLDVKFRIG